MIKLRARSLVIATGTYEIPFLFDNNDLPGVMLGSGIQRLLYLWGVRPGRRAVVVSANRRGLQVALDLTNAGVDVPAVAEWRDSPDSDLADKLTAAGVRILPRTMIAEAQGRGRVRGAVLRSQESGDSRQFDCDLIALSTGFAPANELVCLSGGKLKWDEDRSEFVPESLPENVFAAGEVTATHALNEVEKDGELAGLQAAIGAGFGDDAAQKRASQLAVQTHDQPRETVPWTVIPVPDGTGKKAFVCFCEDVTRKDIEQSIDEGYDSIELLKRYSTYSMGPCQGKMCNNTALRLCAHHNDQTIAETGITTARPPVKPVSLGVLGGRLMEPIRQTPVYE